MSKIEAVSKGLKHFENVIDKRVTGPLLPSTIASIVDAISNSIDDCPELLTDTNIDGYLHVLSKCITSDFDKLMLLKLIGIVFVVDKYTMTLLSNKDLNTRLWEEFAKYGISYQSYTIVSSELSKVLS